MDLSIVIPMFNEAENVEGTFQRVQESLLPYKGSYEIIPVNDGSHDNTLEILKRVAVENRRVKVVSYARNSGRGKALRNGV